MPILQQSPGGGSAAQHSELTWVLVQLLQTFHDSCQCQEAVIIVRIGQQPGMSCRQQTLQQVLLVESVRNTYETLQRQEQREHTAEQHVAVCKLKADQKQGASMVFRGTAGVYIPYHWPGQLALTVHIKPITATLLADCVMCFHCTLTHNQRA